MSSNNSVCIYCRLRPAGNSEHVFPKGLGGQDIYMSNICDFCNNYFSGLEGELFRNSPIALMRSSENVSGYGGKKLREGALTFPEMFQYVEADNVIYEIGVVQSTRGYTRPQLIQIQGDIYAEGANQGEMTKFITAIEKWRQNCGIVVTYVSEDKPPTLGIVTFKLIDGRYISEIGTAPKVKDGISLILLQPGHEYWEAFEPRLFFSEEQRLVLRSRSKQEALKFLWRLLDGFTKDKMYIKSFSGKGTKDRLKLTMKVNVEKMQQALVKIGLNALLFYYPTSSKSPMIDPAIEYVMKGGTTSGLKMAFGTPMEMLDTGECKHLIVFTQLEGYTQVRVSLFTGGFIFEFYLDNLIISDQKSHSAILLVDYKNRRQKFYADMAEFIVDNLHLGGERSPSGF
ncbi:hypothetical protein GO495_02200 [Chitinophaga oryziterrae]|uniref:HNH endonuclease 5 domain-containing protein n=1 Tax=Chitinophaga oryziterrae TaxID=1031224 RepID=A0A6N8J2F0_9BACT|nr:hypothetical protein [Chitinophaga oryziterrae]MVT39385.1 hypothetical protein [Chitinophaga oryziterrae]